MKKNNFVKTILGIVGVAAIGKLAHTATSKNNKDCKIQDCASEDPDIVHYDDSEPSGPKEVDKSQEVSPEPVSVEETSEKASETNTNQPSSVKIDAVDLEEKGQIHKRKKIEKSVSPNEESQKTES